MYPGSDRLTYLCYRCHRCGRVLTKIQILKRWVEAEKDISVTQSAVCACGSRHINPSNPTLFEELTSPSIWVLWWHEVLLPWLRKKLGS